MGGVIQGNKLGYQYNHYNFCCIRCRKYLNYSGDQLVGNDRVGKYFVGGVFYYIYVDFDKCIVSFFIEDRYIFKCLRCNICFENIIQQYDVL